MIDVKPYAELLEASRAGKRISAIEFENVIETLLILHHAQVEIIERLRAMLKRVEFVPDSDHPYCPFCMQENMCVQRHADGCEWVREMGEG